MESSSQSAAKEIEQTPPKKLDAVSSNEDASQLDKENSTESQKKPGQNKTLVRLEEELIKKQKVEDKLQIVLSFMETAISQGQNPNLKDFWSAKKICLNLFKEGDIQPTRRSVLWEKYIELTKEVNKLKEFLEKQNVYEAEQIELAIEAVEKEINHLPEIVSKAQEVDFAPEPKAMQKSLDHYQSIQRELSILNAYASKINSLRKELIKIEMRIRKKNVLFKRLSHVGDLIFPRRKELIKEISDSFVEEVHSFIKEHFNGDRLRKPPYFLRNEIKALQAMAKKLTLNTIAFTETRRNLSQTWDHVKQIEKERKKEQSKQKVVYEQCAQEIQEKFTKLEEKMGDHQVPIHDTNHLLDDIESFVKSQRLDRDTVRVIRQKIAHNRKLIGERRKEELRKELEKKRAEEEERKSEIKKCEGQIQELYSDVPNLSVDELKNSRDTILENIQKLDLRKHEMRELERKLSGIQNSITEKQLSSLTDDELDSLRELNSLLESQQQFKKESKKQLEQYKKASASSGLDIEQAFKYDQLIQEESQNFENIKRGIEQIKTKITEIEQNVSTS